MKQNSRIHRVPTLVLALLLGMGALLAVISVINAQAAYDCTGSGINVKDCEALIALYDGTDGENWRDKTNWLSGSPCANGWFGVTCVNGDRVAAISLPENNLSGTLPLELADLNQLTTLNVFSNTLGGNFPAQVLGLNKLTLLHLGDNGLQGTIPGTIDQLSDLQALWLSKNSFEGEIPASVGNLSNLDFLYLNGNMLRGAVPSAICGLAPTNLNLGHNALDVDTAVSDSCLDTYDPVWRSSQTVPPTDIKFENVALNATNASLTLSWTPIAFSGPPETHPGFYIVVAGTESGVYTVERRTQDKQATGLVIDGLDPGTTYFVRVSTQSNVTADNKNIVLSDPSDEISAESVAIRLADFQAGPGGLPGVIPLGAALLGMLSLGLTAVLLWRRTRPT